MAEPMRVRLHFKYPVLSDYQSNRGFDRSWFLLNPDITTTVADLNDQIAKLFDIDPDTFTLFVDEYAVPPFMSTRFFRENEIISVEAVEDDEDLEGAAGIGLNDRSVQVLANGSTNMPTSHAEVKEEK